MKRLFVAVWVFVFMAVMPVFHAVADNNQCRNLFDNTGFPKTGEFSNNGLNWGTYMGLPTIKLEQDVTYTLSYDIQTNVSTPYMVSIGCGNGWYTKDIKQVRNVTTTNGRVSVTFTPSAYDLSYGDIVAFRPIWGVSESGQYTYSISNVQLEKGSTATSYVPYNPLCATCDGQIENYVSATGTVAQNGTPSPTNPIEPVFYQQGDMILRKVGNIADSYDATTGKITRRVGMKVLDGTESWGRGSYTGGYRFYLAICDMVKDVLAYNMSSQYQAVLYQTPEANIDYSAFIAGVTGTCYGIFIRNDDYTTVQNFKNYLAQQYAAGTPVVVYYPLATETTENWNETTYCAPNIKIATTAYNAARFSQVKTDLDSAVATIREIVTKTINQTAAIASLQADKQTRPEDACPAGKKCLLVETEENGVIVSPKVAGVKNVIRRFFIFKLQ